MCIRARDQSLQAWRSELTAALELAADHLSLYHLTIESGPAFADRLARGGLRGLPDGELSVELFEITQELCGAAGMPAYEVSNHARPDAGSRHNLIYWRGGDYVGIGPGAHGRLTLAGTRWATEAPRAPGGWLTKVERSGAGELPRTTLSAIDHAEEYLLMSLRLSEGTSLARLEHLSGVTLQLKKLSPLVELGLLHEPTDRLITTMKGRLVLNSLLAEIAAALL